VEEKQTEAFKLSSSDHNMKLNQTEQWAYHERSFEENGGGDNVVREVDSVEEEKSGLTSDENQALSSQEHLIEFFELHELEGLIEPCARLGLDSLAKLADCDDAFLLECLGLKRARIRKLRALLLKEKRRHGGSISRGLPICGGYLGRCHTSVLEARPGEEVPEATGDFLFIHDSSERGCVSSGAINDALPVSPRPQGILQDTPRTFSTPRSSPSRPIQERARSRDPSPRLLPGRPCTPRGESPGVGGRARSRDPSPRLLPGRPIRSQDVSPRLRKPRSRSPSPRLVSSQMIKAQDASPRARDPSPLLVLVEGPRRRPASENIPRRNGSRSVERRQGPSNPESIRRAPRPVVQSPRRAPSPRIRKSARARLPRHEQIGEVPPPSSPPLDTRPRRREGKAATSATHRTKSPRGSTVDLAGVGVSQGAPFERGTRDATPKALKARLAATKKRL